MNIWKINASEKKEKNKGHHKSVVQTDKQERPMIDETVAAHKTPWASALEYIRNIGTKSLFLKAIADLQRNWDGPCPIRLKIKHSRVQAVTTQTIKAGELRVPLLLTKPLSVVAEHENIMFPLHHYAVPAHMLEPVSAPS